MKVSGEVVGEWRSSEHSWQLRAAVRSSPEDSVGREGILPVWFQTGRLAEGGQTGGRRMKGW